MRSIAFADFLIGVGILFVLEGLLFAASPAWMRRAMKSALATPDHILRGPDPDLVCAALIRARL
jgi:uncharacterized protein YjeT (DUF2065 family)